MGNEERKDGGAETTTEGGATVGEGSVDPGRATGGQGDAPFGDPQVPWPSDTYGAAELAALYAALHKEDWVKARREVVSEVCG